MYAFVSLFVTFPIIFFSSIAEEVEVLFHGNHLGYYHDWRLEIHMYNCMKSVEKKTSLQMGAFGRMLGCVVEVQYPRVWNPNIG